MKSSMSGGVKKRTGSSVRDRLKRKAAERKTDM
jgi:hypothetical protein